MRSVSSILLIIRILVLLGFILSLAVKSAIANDLKINVVKQRATHHDFAQIYSHNDISTESNRQKVVVIVDVFRAFTTACHILNKNPASYTLALRSTAIGKLKSKLPRVLLIGKPEKGTSLIYDIPNSPARVNEAHVANRHVLHRTEAGAKGILHAKEADVVLAASFVNAEATAKYIQKLSNPYVKIIPMGHEAMTPSLEDNLCAEYIEAFLKGQKINIDSYLTRLKETSGKYFFEDDQWQYPSEDFYYCLDTNRFDFAICAEVHEDFAVLKKCE